MRQEVISPAFFRFASVAIADKDCAGVMESTQEATRRMRILCTNDDGIHAPA
jgi:hypothetical protein